MYDVTTGARNASAIARSSSQAPERRTPLPAQTSGLSAPPSTRAASSRRDESGTTGAGRTSVETVHPQIGLAREHVHRDLQEDRAARRGLRPLPGLGEKLGNVLGAGARADHFTMGSNDARWSRSSWRYPAAAADQVARDLARDRDERDVGARGLHEACEGVQGSGAGGEEQGRRLAACARVAVGREGGVQLGAEADVADGASAQPLPDSERVDPGQAEDGLGAESLEGVHDDVAADARADGFAHRAILSRRMRGSRR